MATLLISWLMTTPDLVGVDSERMPGNAGGKKTMGLELVEEFLFDIPLTGAPEQTQSQWNQGG